MNNFALPATILLAAGAATVACAETETFGHAGIRLDAYDISGSAVNASGSIADEPEDFKAGRLDAGIGFQFDGGLVAALEGHYVVTDNDDFVAPGFPANDAAKEAGQVIASLGTIQNGVYLGGFAGVGTIGFTSDDVDQDADYRLVGIGAGAERGQWAYGGSLTFMDVNATENPEVMDDGVIFKLQAEYALETGNTFVGVHGYYADGVQDTDSSSRPDSVDGYGVGVYVQHKIGQVGRQNALMLDAGLDYIDLSEGSSSGRSDDVSSLRAYVGVTLQFGDKPAPREMRMARAPDTTFVQMVTPIVD